MEQRPHARPESSGNQRKMPVYADKSASYWWKMQMNFDQRVPEMTGYGKFEGRNENKSKEQNLMRIINMLWSKGYFARTREINIYERVAPLANAEMDTLVIQVQHGKIVYFGNNWDIKRFLENFSNLLNKGIKPKVHLRPTT